MGCFQLSVCFSSSRRRESRSQDRTIGAIFKLNEESVREESVENLLSLIKESSKFRDEFEDQMNINGAKKRVTFDLDVKNEKEEEEPVKTNYRYKNSRKSVDEFEDTGLEISDSEEKDAIDDHESSESLFSLSIDSRKQACDTEKGEKEVTSSISVQATAIEPCQSPGKRCRFVGSVLNPIENLTQWEEVKQNRPVSKQVQQEDKENVVSENKNHGSQRKPSKVKLEQQDIRVDTSLSSWLLGSEGRSKSDSESEVVNSAMRPPNGKVLDDKCCGSLSPTRSRSGSSLVPPLIGTVGSYWAHTGQDMAMDPPNIIAVIVRERKECNNIVENKT